ncbi:histone H2A.Z-specific chaperone CHZ1 [Mycena vulgaris]|nr:histone H2A.Z-specific chaperone CHZ1 [Mycena vulgaris]
MSSATTDPAAASATATNNGAAPDASPATDKGKGKVTKEDAMEDEDDEEEDEEDDDDDEEEDESEEEAKSLTEIDPSVIQPRRTRGVKVDYTSPEALAKAGLTATEVDEDEDEDVVMKD